LEDNLMRIFANDWVSSTMEKLGMGEGEAIESRLVSRAIENAQRKVEAHNFDIRKHLLDFDDVANDQRKVIYEQRDDLLNSEVVTEEVELIRLDVFDAILDSYIPHESMYEMWDIGGLEEILQNEFGITVDIKSWLAGDESLDKEKDITTELMRRIEKQVMLDVLDRHWKENLDNMDHLRQGIGLRSFAAKNPKQEYKREAFDLFLQMLENIKRDVIVFLYRVSIRTEEDIELAENRENKQKVNYRHPSVSSSLSNNPQEEGSSDKPYVRGKPKIGRNEQCPCGSGKKYKQCHGRLT
jgi:preprotein translocase subunit SecA